MICKFLVKELVLVSEDEVVGLNFYRNLLVFSDIILRMSWVYSK